MEDTGRVNKRRSEWGRNWTEGNNFHNLLRICWPILISNTFMILGPTIDMIWVGKLGSAAIAGVGVAGVAVQLVMVALMGLVMGMRAMVARFVGAGDEELASHVVSHAFLLSVSISVVVAVVGILFAKDILTLLGLEASVVAQGAVYMRILFAGQVITSFQSMAEGVMQASGDTMTPMKISIMYRIFHIALCPFLIFGWGIFPRLGVSGAAATSVLSQTLGGSLGMWVLFSGRSRLQLSLKNFHLDLNIIWRMIRIGLPALVSGLQRNLSQFFLMWFIAPFGTLAVAAHSINQRVEMILVMPGMAFGIASGVLVGQNLGALKPERAERSAWQAVSLVEGIMVIISLAIFLWADNIVHLFSAEPALIQLGSTFLRISVVGFVVLGIMFVMMHSLNGSGDTLPPMIISVAVFWMIVIPLAYFLSRFTVLGVYGIRWAMVAEMIVAATSLTLYFRTGRWKRKKV